LIRRLTAAALAFAWAACGADLNVIDSPTQVTVRITSADGAVEGALTHLRISAALHESDGSWRRAVSATFDRSELRWPVDIPITPRTPGDASKEFEVIVQALSGPTGVLAETRAVTSFRRNKRVLLPLTLYTCDGPTSDEACADPGCQGASCSVCKADGCVPVGVTDSSELPESDGPSGGDAGRDAAIGEDRDADDADRADGAAASDEGGAGALDASGADTGADARVDGPLDGAQADADAHALDGATGQSDTSTPLCTAAGCDDGRACNGVEVCNPSVGCQPGVPDNGSDDDGDGYSDAQGDCNDCAADINPSAAEIGNNGVDEDCDTQAPAVVPSCDSTLSLTSSNALDGARALGLCKVGVGVRWGALAASYVQPNGTGTPNSVGYGLLPRFGANNPREGSAMLALSSGSARAPGDPGYSAPRPGLQKGYTSAYVPGLSTTTRHCNAINFAQPYDGAALQLTIKVPSNADRMAFDFAYFSADWISGLCNTYNDQFAVMMKIEGASTPAINLAPDELGDVMSVNSQLLAACTCPTAPACSYGIYDVNCSLGADLLAGTGFQTGELAGHSHGGTGWLTASVPVTAGSTITVTALIYDSGDGTYDSLALLDAFRFYRAPAGDGQTAPMVRRAQ
jgi:hypothetical protein